MILYSVVLLAAVLIVFNFQIVLVYTIVVLAIYKTELLQCVFDVVSLETNDYCASIC